MAFLDPILNPIMQPLLDYSPFLSIISLAFVITVIITLSYKLLTDQNEMKGLKEKQKNFQKRMKELRSNPEEMMKVQKEAMKINGEYMKKSLKPTLFTMLPILLIFGWMSGHLMYEPIYPNETFSVTAQFKDSLTGDVELLVDEDSDIIGESLQNVGKENTWKIKSSDGVHLLTVKYGNEEKTKKVLITKELKYEDPVTEFDHSDIESISINYNKLKPLKEVKKGGINIFGWQPGWLGVYIILSIIFSIILRKMMKIY